MTATNNDSKSCSVNTSPLSSSTTVSSTTKKRNTLKTLQRQNIAKIRNYDTKIREQNRKKLLYRKKAENRNYQIQNAYKRNSKNMKTLRAIPMTKNKQNKQNIHPKSKNKQIAKLTKRNLEISEKENNTPMNLKKYEYGNEKVLSFMKKQRKYRAQKQKEIQKKRNSEIQRRKNYISNLNKNQKDRAKKITQKRKTNRVKKSLKPKSSESSIHLISNADEESECDANINKIEEKLNNEQSSKCVNEIDEMDNEMYIEINNGMKDIYENRLFEQNNINDSETKPDTDLLLHIYDCIQKNQANRIEEMEHCEMDNENNDCDMNENDNEFEMEMEMEMENRLNLLKDEGYKLQQRLTDIDNKMYNVDEAINIDMEMEMEMKMENRLNALQNQSYKLQERLENISETLNFTNNEKIENSKNNLVFSEINKCENILNIYNNNSNEKLVESKNEIELYNKLLLELEIIYNMEVTVLKLEKLEELQMNEQQNIEENYNSDMRDIQVILKEETMQKLHDWTESNRLNDYIKQEIMKQNETNEIVDCYTQEPSDNENEEFINKNEIIKSNIPIKMVENVNVNDEEYSEFSEITELENDTKEVINKNDIENDIITENNIENDIEESSIEDTETYTSLDEASVDEAIQNAIEMYDCKQTNKIEINEDEKYSEITEIIEENKNENDIVITKNNEIIEECSQDIKEEVIQNEEYSEITEIIEEETEIEIKKDVENVMDIHNEECTKEDVVIIDEDIEEDDIEEEDIVESEESINACMDTEFKEENENDFNTDLQHKSELIAEDLVSDMITEIFEHAQSLVQFRQNRRAIIEGQAKIEKSLNESMGIFDSNNSNMNILENDAEYVEAYIQNVFEFCNEIDWTLKSLKSIKIDYSVCIYIEEMFNVGEYQKNFNHLIFDTLNEVLMELKLKYMKNKIEPSEKRIIKMVQQKMKQVMICNDTKLKECFSRKNVVDDRIRSISYQWIKEFQLSYEWLTTFDSFKKSTFHQIADMIFEQIITDIVHELNRIEKHRHVYT